MSAVQRVELALLLVASLLMLQGCGVVSYTRAAVVDHQLLTQQYSDCPTPGSEGVCDREFVVVTPPPLMLDCAHLARPGCPKAETPPEMPWSRNARPTTPPAVAEMRTARDSIALARVLLPMAYLSNVVYHRHEVGRPTAARSAPAACLQQQPLSTHPLERAGEARGGWARWPDAAGCAAVDGLFYDTYVRAPAADAGTSAPWQVAIVFRGTENTVDQLGHGMAACTCATAPPWCSGWSNKASSSTICGSSPRAPVPACQDAPTSNSTSAAMARWADTASPS
jgi:hypothetical protein